MLSELLAIIGLICAVVAGYAFWVAKRDEQALVDGLSDAVLLVDEQGRVLHYNEAFAKLCGASIKLFNKDCRKKVYLRHVVRAWIAQGNLNPVIGASFKEKLKHWDERPLSLILSGRSLEMKRCRLPSSHAVYIFSTPLDREQLVRALESSEDSRLKLLNCAPCAALLLCPSSQEILFASKQAKELFCGVGNDELIGRSFMEYVQRVEDHQTVLASLSSTEKAELGLIELRDLCGGSIWVQIYAETVEQEGRLMTYMLLVDMTKHHQAQAVLQSKAQCMLQMLDEIPGPAFIFNQSEGRILFHNRAADTLLGATLTTPDLQFSSLFENELESLSVLDASWREGLVVRHEVRVLCAGEQARRLELVATRVKFNGQAALFCLMQDIDTRHKAEIQLRNTLAETEAINRQLEATNMELERLATTDRLTGAFNRRHFEDVALREMSRARRYGMPLAVIILDIDHFKSINDDYGHAAGDEVLAEFSRLVRTSLRSSDVLARWGGEEFAVLAASSTEDEAWQLAEKLRVLLEKHSIEGIRPVTLSAGVTGLGFRDTLDSFIRRADEGLYEAKETGRNRVVIHLAETHQALEAVG